MGISEVLELILGLCLFLFGMNVMGESLERSAGNGLRSLLGRLTSNKFAGFLTGLGVTAVIQSSSATTVMVVGFVNSGIMTLRQAISVIMGANIGTTVTAWILSLGGIDGGAWYIAMWKPSNFTPILALIGIAMCMLSKSSKKKDIGTILLGFATLMFGMDTMSAAVSGLKDIPEFQQLFLLFKNPILGVLVGAILTGIIQSSSASVGILQALAASTDSVSYGAAIPIIMGQNIGTCVTALISSIGTNKNARRAALVHLSFNIIGTIICLTGFTIVSNVFTVPLFDQSASAFGIAIAHSIFNVICTAILLPMSGLLEKLAIRLVPDNDKKDVNAELDERLLVTPAIALDRCNTLTLEMAENAVGALKQSIASLKSCDVKAATEIRESEEKVDHLEDILGTYLVKLSGQKISENESAEITKLLKLIGDFERISDHSVNILESAEELRDKEISFTEEAGKDMTQLTAAISEILDLASNAFINNDIAAARQVEPLEQVVDKLILKLHDGHIKRLKSGDCSIESGFILNDLTTNFERVADHCSNIAIRVIDASENNMNIHESLRDIKQNDPRFEEQYALYKQKYLA
ncbi:MAG: Na/Pi cotransporter family protein [Clostridia bacterium]|nr:Na/Pi cotransporter family protein [Clostridia bacterium]